MSYTTARSIRRKLGKRSTLPTLAGTLSSLAQVGVKPKTLGKRRLGARVLHSFYTHGTAVLMTFRHPTKKATSGRLCVLSL